MNKRIIFFRFIFALCLCSVALTACKDDKDDQIDNNTYNSTGGYQMEENIAASQVAISNINNLVLLAIDSPEELSAPHTIITKEKANASQSSDYPMLLTIDFGTDTSVCFDGRYRAGRIKAKISKPWKETGSVMEIQSVNYYFDTRSPISAGSNTYYKTSCGANISMNITCLGATTLYDGTKSYPTQRIQLSSATISIPNGEVMLLTDTSSSGCAYNFFKGGFSTESFDDDTIMSTPCFEGSAFNKINNKTYIFSLQRVTNKEDGQNFILLNRYCYWPVAGDVKLLYRLSTQNSYISRIINFGSITQQTCENIASYLINGKDIAMSLP